MAAVSQISILSFDKFGDTTERFYSKWPERVPGLEEAKMLTQQTQVPFGTGNRRVFTEVDSETFARFKSEGAQATKAQVIEGYTKTVTMRTFAAEIDITREARLHGKNQEIIKKLQDLSHFCPQRMLIDITHQFTFHASTTYVDMDGETVNTAMGDTLAMSSAVHTLTGTATTYSAVITGNPIFSAGGLDIAKNQARTQTLDNFGNRRVMMFNTVVTTFEASTVRAVDELLESTGAPDGAHSGVANIDKNSFRHVKLFYLDTDANGAYDSTKRYQWHYIARGELELYLHVYESPFLRKPLAGNNGEDMSTYDWTFGSLCSYAIGMVSARGSVTSDGTGS